MTTELNVPIEVESLNHHYAVELVKKCTRQVICFHYTGNMFPPDRSKESFPLM
jgi:hypothetical protein